MNSEELSDSLSDELCMTVLKKNSIDLLSLFVANREEVMANPHGSNGRNGLGFCTS
jgi:hypothetical protein